MQLRVSDLLNDLHERTDLVEDRIEGIESKISQIQKNIESLPDRIGIDFIFLNHVNSKKPLDNGFFCTLF